MFENLDHQLLRYKSPNMRHDLFYWLHKQRNCVSEVDYVDARNGLIVPIEVKAGVQGGMKSLWIMMREKKLSAAYRCSLENFGHLQYCDAQDNGTIRHLNICPLYAMSQME